MAFTYDLATSLGQVRFLVSDTDEDTAVFTDAEVTAALTMEGNVVKLAAARCFYVLAGSKAKLAVRISRGNVSDDMTALAKELREQAKMLRDEVAEDGDLPLEATITPDWERFSYRENVLLDRQDEVRTP